MARTSFAPLCIAVLHAVWHLDAQGSLLGDQRCFEHYLRLVVIDGCRAPVELLHELRPRHTLDCANCRRLCELQHLGSPALARVVFAPSPRDRHPVSARQATTSSELASSFNDFGTYTQPVGQLHDLQLHILLAGSTIRTPPAGCRPHLAPRQGVHAIGQSWPCSACKLGRPAQLQ